MKIVNNNNNNNNKMQHFHFKYKILFMNEMQSEFCGVQNFR
jgi:hypothetical protein